MNICFRKHIIILLLAGLLLGVVGCMNPPVQTDITSPEDSTRLPETTVDPETTVAPETTKAPSITIKRYTPKTVEGEADTLAFLQTFFTAKAVGSPELLILDRYEELLGAYAYVKAPSPDGSRPITRQNVTEAELTDVYPPEYFETGYLVALCDYSSVSNAGIEYESKKRGKYIVVNETYFEPFRRFILHSGILYLFPMEGTYEGERVEFKTTYTAELPEPSHTPEGLERWRIDTYRYTPKTVEGEADTLALLQTVFTEENFSHEELIIIDSYEELLGAYAYLNNPLPPGHRNCTRQNVTEAEATGAYPPEYFETGYLIALCDYATIYNPGIECDAEKRGDVIVVNEHYCDPFMRADLPSTIFYLLPLEGTYAGETVEFNYIRTSEPPRY